jgi:hypothetical protein
MRLVNDGDVPLRVTADARLLSFELTAPGARATLRCALPDDMRPTNDVDRALVVPPHRAYAETFDPRLYCFGTKEAAALAPGTTVVAHMGWPSPPAPPAPVRGRRAAPPRPLNPPFEVSPIEGIDPAVAPLKEVLSAAFIVPADPAAPSTAIVTHGSGTQVPQEPFPVKLTLASPAHVDTWSLGDTAIPITIKNVGTRPVTLLARPETIGYDVIGPAGSFRCVWPTRPPAPIREMFTTLRPNGVTTTSVLLSAVCPDATFSQPGLFIVRPHLDTRGASGDPIGIHTFDGEVIGTSTTILRVHHGTQPQRWERPHLE